MSEREGPVGATHSSTPSAGSEGAGQSRDPRIAAAMHRRWQQRKVARDGDGIIHRKAAPGGPAAAEAGPAPEGEEQEAKEGDGEEQEAKGGEGEEQEAAEGGEALPIADEGDASEAAADDAAEGALAGKNPKKKLKEKQEGAKEGESSDEAGEEAAQELVGEMAQPEEGAEEKAGEAGDSAVKGGEAPKVAMKRAPGKKGNDGASAATSAIAGKGAGESLPGAVSEHFSSAYGHDMSGVRVHTDSKSAQAADRAGAEAFTYGKDVFFGTGRYNMESDHGQFVLAHELAHVAQQGSAKVRPKRIETGHSSDAEEGEASDAADAALAGGTASVGSAAPKVRFFAQGDGSKNRGGHAFVTENTLATMGLSDEGGGAGGPSEVRQARMGNWERDMSQALTPTTAAFVQPIFPMLNVLAIKDFGRGINASEFGTYDPVEHLDNPTDLRGTDVLAQGGMTSSGGAEAGKGDNPDNANTIGKGGSVGPAGEKDEAYADKDERYKAENGHKDKGKVINPEDARAYQVDESAIPHYMYASKTWCIETLRNSARLGRGKNAKGEEKLEGPRMFASGTHTLQDYFAHSNFCEIGLNMLIREGGLQVMQASGEQKDIGQIDEVKGRVLDSKVHANDEKGNPEEGNLATAPMEEGGREVLTTGSFNLTDTAASILEEVSDNWKMLDPFKEKNKGPSQVTEAALDYLEMNPEDATEFNGFGATIADMVDAVKPQVETLGNAGAGAVEKGGGMLGKGIAGAGRLGGGLLGGIGNLANKGAKKAGGGLLGRALGGIGSFFGGAGKATEEGGQAAGDAVSGAASQTAEAIRFFIGQIDGFSKGMRGKQHTLREAYAWLSEHGPLDMLKAAAKQIPVIGPAVAALVETVQNKINTMIEKMFATAWNKVIDKGVEKINGVIGQIKAETNVKNKKKTPQGSDGDKKKAEMFGNVSEFYDQDSGQLKKGEDGQNVGIAPGAYTPPSHTEVAKDHGEIENKAGTHHGGEEGEEGGEGHHHEGAWLNPVALQLAQMATQAVSVPVAQIWDNVDAGTKVGPNDPRLNAIDDAINQYFQHPADCSFWRAPLTAAAGSERLGPELLEQLASKKGGAPDVPSLVEIPKDHPANQGEKEQQGGGKSNEAPAAPPP
jgi:Domain of unknown function (DUF4157)/Heterokaryon incompatibility protein Het-C